MRNLTTTAGVAALCLAALPAFAELTPEQVWGEVTSLYESTYPEVSHDEPRRDGDTLIVENLTLATRDDEVAITMSVAEMRLRAVDADTVEITTSEEFDIDLEPLSDDMPGDIDLAASQSGLVVTATGAPGDIDWAYRADNITARVAGRETGEQAEALVANFALNDFLGDISTNSAGDLYAMTGSYQAGEMIFDFSGGDETDSARGEGRFDGMTVQLDAALPLDLMSLEEEPEPSELFEAGFRIVGDATFGPMTMTMSGNSVDSGAFSAAFTSGEGTGALSLTPEGLSLSEDVADMTFRVEAEGMPVPIDVSLASFGFGMDIPATQDQPGQDLGVRFSLIDLVAGDDVWAMFDPQGQLPRDPASLDLSLQGTGMPVVNIFDEDAAVESEEFPFKMETLNLETLLVSALGAQLTGTGAFTFGDEPSAAFGGMQPIIGSANLQLTGLNSALDALVSAGVVPANQLMGVRMMLGTIAVPDGEDSYKSEIELREDGAVMVNGNRMR